MHCQFLEGKAATVAATSVTCHRCCFLSCKIHARVGLRGLASRGSPDNLKPLCSILNLYNWYHVTTLKKFWNSDWLMMLQCATINWWSVKNSCKILLLCTGYQSSESFLFVHFYHVICMETLHLRYFEKATKSEKNTTSFFQISTLLHQKKWEIL